MIITNETLEKFGACNDAKSAFAGEFPDGLDISGLWGDADLRQNTWMTIFSSPVCKKNLGWAIYVGLIPARITADLAGADLSRTNLARADLSRTNLAGANLSRANLAGADLTGADLTGANLTGADLTGANLSRADLTGADLTGANLRWADLTGADLRWADLTEADLSEADLRWTKGLKP